MARAKRPYLSHTGRASNAEKQPSGPGPEGCDENGPAAALLVGHVSVQICSLLAPCRRPILITTKYLLFRGQDTRFDPFVHKPMSDRLTRRNFLAAVGTAAVSRGLLSRLAFAADEPAQTPHSTLGTNSTLDYGSTRELVAMLANRKISAVELLEHAIARIEALDQRINAVVVRDFERAHSAAVAADAALARGERAPLLGLPMTVKEAINVTGMPTTWGMPMFKGWMPKQDSVVIARLKSAGAIIIGKTNVPFAISDWQSYNEIYGTTNNPWDLSRTPGGSSGGAAAALAAGYVSLELGSDLAGSIRAPAAFCGVFGHKPSYGVVPLGGFAPPTVEQRLSADSDLAVLGPMARTAADLALALDVLAGPEDRDATAYRLALPPPRHVDSGCNPEPSRLGNGDRGPRSAAPAMA